MSGPSDDDMAGQALVRWSLHALREVRRRSLSVEQVEQVAREPEQVVAVRPGREVRQSRDDRGGLVRVIMAVEENPPLIVTAYRTSKVQKYWQVNP